MTSSEARARLHQAFAPVLAPILAARAAWRAARTPSEQREAFARYQDEQTRALADGRAQGQDVSGVVIGAIYDAQVAERAALRGAVRR